MGDRASYAIVEDGRLELFFGNWGAATLLADIFWGPAICEAQIRRQEAATTWLDDVFGEAAVALCKDTRVVTFYDSRFDEPTRLTAARLMEGLWPGWTVRSVSYVSAVAASVGVDLVSNAAPNILVTLNPELALDRVGRLAAGELPRDGVVHWTRETARSAHVSNEPLARLLLCGPRLIEALPRMLPLDEALRSWSTRFARGALLTAPALGSLLAVAIDETTKVMCVTVAPSIQAVGDRAALRGLAALWSEWQVNVAIAPLERHFSELGEPLPAHLVPTQAPPALGEQIRVLRTALAAEATVERRRLFDQAARAIHTEGVAVADVVRPAEENVVRSTDREVLASTLTRVAGWGTFALRQPMDAGAPIGIPSLLVWREPGDEPQRVCELPRGPLRTPGVHGIPGDARLLLAPSGRALLAILETAPISLVWIDLTRAEAREIATANRLALLGVDANVEWSSNADRFAISVTDTLASRCGEGRVVVYDADRGWLAESTGPTRIGFAEETTWPPDGGLAEARMTGHVGALGSAEVERRLAIVTADRETGLARAAYDEERHQATKDHAHAAFKADPASPAAFTVWCEALERDAAWAEVVHACERHLGLLSTSREAWLALSNAARMRGDLPRAVEASVRCVEVAPHWVNAHWFAAGMLALSGRLDEGAAAAEQAVACDRQFIEKIALDPDLAALHGHTMFRALDYARLLATARDAASLEPRRALYAQAIDLAPERHEAHEALLVLERGAQDLDRALTAAERWCALSPSSIAAAQARCELLVDLGHLDDAAREAADILARHEGASLAHLQLARIALRRGDERGCLAHMRLGERAFANSEHDAWTSYLDDQVQRYEELASLAEQIEELR